MTQMYISSTFVGRSDDITRTGMQSSEAEGGSAQLDWWLGEMYKRHDGSVLVSEKHRVIYHGCNFT